MINAGQSLNIIGSTINGNTSDSSAGAGGEGGKVLGGGALVVVNGATGTIADSTIATNLGLAGGGSKGEVQGGGLLAVANEKGSLAMTGSTFARNAAEASGEAGGGNLFVVNNSKVTLADSIVANGVGSPGFENCFMIKAESLGFNLDTTDQCGFKSPGDLVNANPQLGPLQQNGGPTATIAPALTSPAVDAGRAFGIGADQRGAPRPVDLAGFPNSAAPGADGADIGAIELQPAVGLSLGALTKNKKKGTAELFVTIAQPAPTGTVTLSGKGLVTQSVPLSSATELRLAVLTAKGPVRKALRKKGKRKVGFEVTYVPSFGASSTQSLQTKLVKKRAKKPAKKRRKGKSGPR